MGRTVYRFSFQPSVDLADVESNIVLAFLSAEAIHGAAQVQMDARHAFDPEARCCVIAADTPAGSDVCRLFTSYLQRELQDGQFQIERIQSPASPTAAVVF